MALSNLTFPSVLILDKTQTRVFLLCGFLVKSIMNYHKQIKNCVNSRTSNDINSKVGPKTKLEKRDKTTSNKN